MSLTLLYRGKNVSFLMKLKKIHWILILVAFFLVSLSLAHLFLSGTALPEKPLYYTASHLNTNSSILNNNPEQLTALTVKVAELQSQILRINALGERLAEASDVPTKEFNFNELPPHGGTNIEANILPVKSINTLFSEVNVLATTFNYEEKQLNMLESLLFEHNIETSGYLSGRPIKKGWLSSYFGTRKDPFNGRPTMHKGVDFAGKENADIIATAAGVVSWAEDRGGYGYLIEIDHGKGIKTRYAHNKLMLVSVGQVIKKGQVIAKMGSTGRSTGAHVHYEILKDNKAINPIKYIYRKAK